MTQEQGFPDYAPLPDIPTHDGFGPSMYTPGYQPYYSSYEPYGYPGQGDAQASLFFPFFGFPFFRPFPFFPPFFRPFPFYRRPFFW